MDFDDLIGKTVGFHGVDCNAFCVSVESQDPYADEGLSGMMAFEAVEDECDGYRSCLRELNPIPLEGKIFFAEPIARLTVEADPSLQGHRLVDESGHVWLKMGTDYWDDYYPCFRFDYDPPRD